MSKINPIATISDRVAYHLYDPRLPAVVEQIKNLILSQLPAIPVEHVGSTAILGGRRQNTRDLVIPAKSSIRGIS